MTNTDHEDAIMKTGFEYFRSSIVKMLGVKHEFVDVGLTELVELTITKRYMDFTFLTTEDKYAHFEFQTTDKKTVDLRRFRVYEAVLSQQQGKEVITYVIYSGGMTNAVTEMRCGINTYKVQPIYLKAKDADEVLDRLKEKQNKKEALTEEDFAELSLTPIMSSTENRRKVMEAALKIAKQANTVSGEKVMSIVYTFADKFLNGEDLEEFKEVFRMTRLGQMLFDDGEAKGKAEGKVEGILETLFDLVKDGILSIVDASGRASMSEQDFECAYQKFLEKK